MITLNHSGAFLWTCLQQDTTEQQMVSALLQEYDVDEVLAKKDVAAFTENLRSHGLLEE
jgi:hypothetical protein